MNDFISIADCTPDELRHLLAVSRDLKEQLKLTGRNGPLLAGQARSLATVCGKLGLRFIAASPPGYQLDSAEVDRIMTQVPNMDFETTDDPVDAVRDADVLYTDTWVSMGQEAEKAKRVKEFAGFTIDDKLLAEAPRTAIVLHC